jgi:endonuclease/exonuclease/phosphatase (EEP) superfamily protein YafD
MLDVASHFWLHAAVGGLLVGLPIALILRRRLAAIAAVLGTGLAIALGAVHYRAPNSTPPTGPSFPLRILSYNTKIESAFPSPGDPVFAWIRSQDPDVIVLVECWTGFVAAEPWLRETYPHRIEPKPGKQWAMLLLSKYPFEEMPLAPFSGEIQSSFTLRRSVLVAHPSGGRFMLTGAHYASPRSGATWEQSLGEAERDARGIRAWLDRTSAEPVPLIVAGDFNSTPVGRIHRLFERVSGLHGWTPRVGAGTWPARLPAWLGIPIDRVWASDGVSCRRMAVGPRFGSDHRPIVVELEVPVRSYTSGSE